MSRTIALRITSGGRTPEAVSLEGRLELGVLGVPVRLRRGTKLACRRFPIGCIRGATLESRGSYVQERFRDGLALTTLSSSSSSSSAVGVCGATRGATVTLVLLLFWVTGGVAPGAFFLFPSGWSEGSSPRLVPSWRRGCEREILHQCSSIK